MTEPLLLSPTQVAEALGVSPRHVRRMMDEQGLPYVRVGKNQRHVPAAALPEWIAQNTRATAEPHPGQPHDPIPTPYVVGNRAYVARVCSICGRMLTDGHESRDRV